MVTNRNFHVYIYICNYVISVVLIVGLDEGGGTKPCAAAAPLLVAP
jgi:hypothetical protein